ncbi:MAG: nuclear transport factor 2 family protein [Acidimicrobiales bacterium]|nr:nuclear transport factor 2 family protein [Acidimicrobiales bacterium]|tara:strand:- start:170 stop:583 length:414 start_codon:yes stop_codon:yes gene_type:complete
MGIADEPLEVVASYLASFATGNPDAIAAHVSEDFKNIHTSALAEPSSGRATYRERLPGFLNEFDGVTYEIVETFAEGNRVAAAYTMRADYRGSQIEIQGMFRFLVSKGLITQRVDYFDSLNFLKQTGGTQPESWLGD